MFNSKYDIVSIGSATRDVFLNSANFESRRHADSPTGTEQCFPLGSKIEINKMVFTTGGGGTNAAVTFARQGLKTADIGVVGRDFNGRAILEELAKTRRELKGMSQKLRSLEGKLNAHANANVSEKSQTTIKKI